MQRLRCVDGFTGLPDAVIVGAVRQEGLIRAYGRMIGGELGAVGVNMDLAPVLDVNDSSHDPVIGPRSFGATPERVETAGLAFIAGLHGAGIAATGKHVPGHGSTSTDSHFTLPVVNKDRAGLAAAELRLFRAAVGAGIDAIILAHVVYPSFDSSGLPATVSRPIASDLLRGEMGFAGLAVTNDMGMRGIADLYPPEQSAVQDVLAGADVVLCARLDPPRSCKLDLLERLRDGLPWAASDGTLPMTRIDELVARILALKSRYTVGPAGGAGLDRVGGTAHARVVGDILEASGRPWRPRRDRPVSLGLGASGDLASRPGPGWQLRACASSARGFHRTSGLTRSPGDDANGARLPAKRVAAVSLGQPLLQHLAQALVLGAARLDPRLPATELLGLVQAPVDLEVARREAHLERPAASNQQGQKVRQGRQGGALDSVHCRPERVERPGRLAVEQHSDAEATRGVLHRVHERPDLLDVVADVGDEGDISPDVDWRGPARLDDPHVVDTLGGHALTQHGQHALGDVQRDDLLRQQGDRQRVAPATGANVQPGVGRLDQGAQDVQRRLVLPPRVLAEPRRDRRIEVLLFRRLAVLADLLVVGTHAPRPASQELVQRQPQLLHHPHPPRRPAATGRGTFVAARCCVG
ncbi:MAG: hypothetical protein IT307_18125 [Chloroflexi bacterium]|nr:hypothetical protein [Chloroflexota bacterium]